MLELRRIIEFSSKAHSFLLILYLFLALLFVLFLFYPVNERLVSDITVVQMVLGWTIFLEGIWVVFGSVLCSFYSKVIIFSPALKTILRLVIYFLVSCIIDITDSLITGGFSYGHM